DLDRSGRRTGARHRPARVAVRRRGYRHHGCRRVAVGRVSGRGGPVGQTNTVRVQLPLLERLIDDAPERDRDPPMTAAEAMQHLRQSVRRELEALLNARRRWRSPPRELTELPNSPLGYGIPDFAAGVFNNQGERDRLRLEIEATIRRFEPRFLSVRVHLTETEQRLD